MARAEEDRPLATGSRWVLATMAGAVVARGAGIALGTQIGDAGVGLEPGEPMLIAG